jgi:hypothetical protein
MVMHSVGVPRDRHARPAAAVKIPPSLSGATS